MTLESAFPWISLLAAVGAGAAASGSGKAEKALKVVALGALAAYAYFRWIAPTAVSIALCLQALGQALSPRGPARWRTPCLLLSVAAWLTLANLYWGAGDGFGVFLGDGAKAALLAALVIGGGYGLRRIWPRLPGLRVGICLETGALGLMFAAALTLDWGFGLVLAGAALVIASAALTLYAQAGFRLEETTNVRRTAWALAFLGQAAMAYAFLR